MSDRLPCARCGSTSWLWRHELGFCFDCVEAEDIELAEAIERGDKPMPGSFGAALEDLREKWIHLGRELRATRAGRFVWWATERLGRWLGRAE